jgi:hypothetical protein
MEAKLKAKEIVNKIKDDLFNKRAVKITDEDAALCALIAVDEILICCIGSHEEYWQEVKKEIKLL